MLTLMAVEGVVRVPSFWTLDTRSSTGRPKAVADTMLRRSSDVHVVMMGSSRLRDDVSPRVLAEALNLRAGRVVNLSFSAGTPLDFLATYREHRSTLRDAQVLLIGVEDRQFNWTKYKRGSPSMNRVRQHASFSQRLRIPGWRDRVDLLVGWLWRTWDARYLLKGYGQALLSGGISREELAVDELGQIPHPKTPRPTDDAARKDPHQNFRPGNFASLHLSELAELVALATQDGTNVVLVDPPQSPVSRTEIAKSFAAEDALWRQRVMEATGLLVDQIPFQDAQCIQWQDCYWDYDHLNALGAQAYSKALASWLIRQFPPLFPGAATTNESYQED